MHKGKAYDTNQDRRSLAALSIVALCLKTLLPLLTALFISTTAAAQSQQTVGAIENEQELAASLQLICTPAGILQIEGDDQSFPNSFMEHCDHCITGGFLSLSDPGTQTRAPFFQSLSDVWHIANQDKVTARGYSRPASRAPPRA